MATAAGPAPWPMPPRRDGGDDAESAPPPPPAARSPRRRQATTDSPAQPRGRASLDGMPHDDLLAPHRRLAVVSTAAPPWLTGTAVNPALRAAFLAAAVPPSSSVTLVVPWLPPADQAELFPGGVAFPSPEAHEAALRAWVAARAGFQPAFSLLFYPARYDRTLLGVFPVGDLAARVAADVRPHAVVLEEPEHLTWHHAGDRWTAVAPHVVGVVHTNYRELGGRNAGPVMGWVADRLTHWLVAAHCHVVVKLSDAIQPLPRSVTACVHGVAPAFLSGTGGGGDAPSSSSPPSRPAFTRGAYALGKVVFGKGWEELVALLSDAAAALPPGTRVAAYGEGAALATVTAAAAAAGAPLDFLPRRDHLDDDLKPYRAFVNASTSDVVATTSLEALAMGKWLVCADHPCNAFAARFGNALTYRSAEEFGAALARALSTDPSPLTPAEADALTWPAATRRLADVCRVANVEGVGGDGGGGDAAKRGGGERSASAPPRRRLRRSRSMAAAAEAAFAKSYSSLLALEPLRVAVGAGAGTREAPADGLTYQPPTNSRARGGGGAGASRLGAALVALVASRPGGRLGAGGGAWIEWGERPDGWDWRWR